MSSTLHELTVGLIGDQLPAYARAQHAAVEMIRLAAEELGINAEVMWIATSSIETKGDKQLRDADVLWCSPGSPYLSLEGALAGIRFARENNWPFLGTCAGFQHTVLEYARNVTGLKDAASEEYEPNAESLLVTSLVCPIATKTLAIQLLEGSRVAAVYGTTEIEEYYYCNFGLNPAFRKDLEASGLRVVGVDQNEEPRVVELAEHRFFIATLFVPGASAVEGVVKLEGAHPLVKAFLSAGLAFNQERSTASLGRAVSVI